MNKRLILKTVLICTGIFILIFSSMVFYFLKNYQLDTEPRINVLIASSDINQGDIIREKSLSTKTIKASAVNKYMLTDTKSAIGQKMLNKTAAGDYIRQYDLLPPQKWHADDDRIIVVQTDIKTRNANLIKKGSFVDVVTLPTKDLSIQPRVVLSKIEVYDVLDETGNSVGSEIGNRIAFLKLILNNAQRESLYSAMASGSIGFELYCNKLQPSLKQ